MWTQDLIWTHMKHLTQNQPEDPNKHLYEYDIYGPSFSVPSSKGVLDFNAPEQLFNLVRTIIYE